MSDEFKQAFERGKAANGKAAAVTAAAAAQAKQEQDAGKVAAEKWINENVRPVFDELQRQMEGLISVALPGAPRSTPVGWTDKITLGNRPIQRRLAVTAFTEGHVLIYVDEGEGKDFGSVHEPKAAVVKKMLEAMVEEMAKAGG